MNAMTRNNAMVKTETRLEKLSMEGGGRGGGTGWLVSDVSKI